MATIREVSQLARVSPATVSRVLNGTITVSDATRRRVLAAVAELDYRPNPFARGLATNRSAGLGVMVNTISSPFYGALLHGVEQVAEQLGYHVMVASGYTDLKKEQGAIAFLESRKVDALIVHPEAMPDAEVIERGRGGLPLVLVGRYIAEMADSAVYLDNERGGYLATEHLLANGHRRIGHIAGPLWFPDSRDRLLGYRFALQASGVAFDEALVVEADFEEAGGEKALHRLLARPERPTAVFAANDQMAAGAMRAARQQGLEVPQDISIVGYDDVLIGRYLHPALTTVRQPLVDMGKAAARIAIASVLGKSEEVSRRFEPELVIRESVAALG